jgi:Concanavalin A-like lectin/glucanases superfamily
VTLSFVPSRSGPNSVTAQSVAADATWSEPVTYSFLVREGTAPEAHWKLDEPEGATTLQAVTRENEPAISAQPHGGLTLGVRGQIDTAMKLDGTSGYATVDGPVVDTTKSYAVSTWVKPTSTAPKAVVVSQSANGRDEFALFAAAGHWAFGKAGSADPAVAADPFQVGEWAHLVGSYDATANKIRLYVNGDLAAEKPFTASPLDAQGPFLIGAGSSDSTPTHFFKGKIDEVRVYDRILVAPEVSTLSRQEPVLAARWKLNVDGSDDTGAGHILALKGGAAIDAGSGFFGGASPAGLLLNGTNGFAKTTDPVVRTDRSFTITAWVSAPSRPTRRATMFSQAGANVNAFALRYVPNAEDPEFSGRWQIEMATEDSATAQTFTAEHPGYSDGWWDHLALVYDAPHDTMKLYVNGQLAESSTKAGVRSFKGTSGLQIGRSKLGDPEFWPGSVDDVWVYQGALTEEQILVRAAPVELETPSSD